MSSIEINKTCGLAKQVFPAINKPMIIELKFSIFIYALSTDQLLDQIPPGLAELLKATTVEVGKFVVI